MLLKNRILLSLSIFLLTNIHYLQAQHKPVKFGKVSPEELSMEYYDLDSSASAVILSDVGSSRFQMEKSSGNWKLIFKRHTRIKILSKDGYDYANRKISLYDPNSGSREGLTSLKGVSYNMEGGKVVKSKMGNEAVFEERVNRNWKSKNFTLPNVKVGTVLEYSYIISSDFIWSLRAWDFQHEIPIQISQYKVTIPEFFNYQFLMQGYEAVSKTIVDKPEKFLYDWESKPLSGGSKTRGVSELPSDSKRHEFIGTNIPAFIKESYLDTYKNYISKISFELLSVNYRDQPMKKYMGTWDQLNTTMLESNSFGTKIDQASFLKKIVAEVTAGMDSDEDKIMAILNYVKSNVRWTGSFAKFLNTNLKDPLNDGEGSSAEINLLLVAMLQRAGLNADPVILSTTNHGMVKKQYAISNQFNYVICIVDVAGKSMLIDATEHFLPVGMLPKRCLNESGRIISKTRPGWINLDSDQKRSIKISGELKLSKSGELEGAIKKSYGGYNARSHRVKYAEEGEDDYIENQISKSTLGILNLEVENGRDYSSSFVQKMEISYADGAQGMGELIYLDPLLIGAQKENPFKLEERKYPVIYPTKEEVVYLMSIEIPEGYMVDEKPEPFVMALPERAGSFKMHVSIMGQKISVLSKFNINKKMFVQYEYEALKTFYNKVIAAQSTQIVLRKI